MAKTKEDFLYWARSRAAQLKGGATLGQGAYRSFDPELCRLADRIDEGVAAFVARVDARIEKRTGPQKP